MAELNNMVQVINAEGKLYELVMNTEEMKATAFGNRSIDLKISVKGQEIENVESTVYHGSHSSTDKNPGLFQDPHEKFSRTFSEPKNVKM